MKSQQQTSCLRKSLRSNRADAKSCSPKKSRQAASRHDSIPCSFGSSPKRCLHHHTNQEPAGPLASNLAPLRWQGTHRHTEWYNLVFFFFLVHAGEQVLNHGASSPNIVAITAVLGIGISKTMLKSRNGCDVSSIPRRRDDCSAHACPRWLFQCLF